MSFLDEVNVDNLHGAVAAALDGPERKKIKFARHTFNVKPATIKRENGEVTIVAGDGHHISHHVSMAPDHQIHYSATRYADGKWRIHPEFLNRWESWIGEIEKTLERAAKIAAAFKEAKSDDGGPPDDKPLLEATAHYLDGTWEGEAKFLIAQIVLRA